MPAGYSGTPLAKKLGFKSSHRIKLFNAPEHYWTLFEELPEDIYVDEYDSELDVIHYFTQSKTNLERDILMLKDSIKKSGMIWVSWPKGKSKLEKDLNENDVRDIILRAGLVDVKVAAIDEDWSGLKIMWRKKDR